MEMFESAKEWCGIADLMRYEILYQHGGFYADADSISVRPLDETLLQNKMFVCYASEQHRPGYIANGFIGAVAGHVVLEKMIEKISRMDEDSMYRWGFYKWKLQKRHIPAWKTVGTILLTPIIRKYSDQVKILPSVSFIPKYYGDEEERVIYARHLWGSTLNNYPN